MRCDTIWMEMACPIEAGIDIYNTAFTTTFSAGDGDTHDGDATTPNASATSTGYELMNDLDFEDAAS